MEDLFVFKEDLNIFNIKESLNKKGYNEVDLCAYYITGFTKVGQSVKSDLRYDDKNESLNTRHNRDGSIQISDFGYKTGMTIFKYIEEKYYAGHKHSFIKALDRVCIDFKLDDIIPYYHRDSSLKQVKQPLKLNAEIKHRVDVTIRKRARKFTELDKAYWLQFGITLEQLKVKGIQSICRFQIINPNKDSNLIVQIKPTDLAYSYPERVKGRRVFKIYLPYGLNGNKGFKWFSNVPNEVVFNLRFTPKKCKLLIIQSSYKDAMVLENFGYSSIPLNGEGMWYPPKIWEYIKSNYDKILYFGDNDFEKKDNPGVMLCNKWKELHGVDFIHTPDNTKSDISDYYKEYGYDETKLLLKRLI